MKKISFVLPVFNEEENISLIYKKILENFDQNKYDYEFIFVDDGSIDNTLEKIKEIKKSDNKVKVLSFIKNYGHQIAIKAGYDHASGDAVITMDGDSQHPPNIINSFIKSWENGNHIVHGIKKKTRNISVLKNFFSKTFYFIFWILTSKKIKRNLSDYRLISKKVVEYIRKQKNISYFFRMELSGLDLKQDHIEFQAEDRKYGSTKYTLSKNLKLLFEGISSVSDTFIIINSIFMFIISILFICLLIYIFYLKFITNVTIPGQASILVSIFFVGIILLTNTSLSLILVNKILNNLSGKNDYVLKDE
tara:strand:- start:1322 stop:2239 length:918 start_codon:yes stop_codon:yes gene_type:complete